MVHMFQLALNHIELKIDLAISMQCSSEVVCAHMHAFLIQQSSWLNVAEALRRLTTVQPDPPCQPQG